MCETQPALFPVDPPAGAGSAPAQDRAVDAAAPPTQPATATVVYTDGACRGNPGPGGWAWLVPKDRYAFGSDPRTTNQRMELTAALDALRSLSGPLEVHSDSTYVVNCFRDRWWEGWLRRGWQNANRKPVANRDLWEPLVELYRARSSEIVFRWVRGHSGDPLNDAVDALAVRAAQEMSTGSGLVAEL